MRVTSIGAIEIRAFLIMLMFMFVPMVVAVFMLQDFLLQNL
jgi:hypothetical protein